ncbi:MAG: PKD domain-containing protein [Candidatus Cloacimonetes bacterium]|jgi:hypothetical protein|nr:PKD domain-containing protein [Candidatus Cloacimonadota bacterium]MBT6994461.1 PKD domain-containing protein [Candidatus Cloacimonadota bacterium]MBT7470244.1 PKD domain-containing protein [Candidatus Cloacimonadota bacterium]
MKHLILITVLFFSIYMVIDACTIGVAAGSATSDGRPIIWKNRDMMAEVVVHYFEEFPHKFIGVGNENSDYIWMGVNEYGFAILNSTANFPDEGYSEPGNGDTMKHALANFSTVVEFEAFLDSTNITGRDTHANMAVLDSTGAAILYEVANTEYWKFDTADEEDGFLVRGVFAFNEGISTSANYERSYEIISGVASNNNLNVSTILHHQMREFNDTNSEHIPIPFDGNWDDSYPYGYTPLLGINNAGTGSGVVIQGILPEEPVDFTTMWTLLGQPALTMAFPLFPVGTPPLLANDNNNSALYDEYLHIKSIISNHMPFSVDSFKLLNENNLGFWTQIYPQEDYLIAQIESLKNDWLTNSYEISDIINTQNEFANFTLNTLSNVNLETEIIPNFSVNLSETIAEIPIQFFDNSLHNPNGENWEWDFDNNGNIDSNEQNPIFTYENVGNYTVSLTVNNEFTEIKEDFISIVEILFGDVDENGQVQAMDVSLTLQNAIGLIDFMEEQINLADVDGNGQVQAFDASLILQFVVGLIDEFPVE